MALEDIIGKPDWTLKAVCKGQTDAFFAESADEQAALRPICMACPVRAECKDYAIEGRETNGLWGGLTEVDLRRERRKNPGVGTRARNLVRGKRA